MVVNSGNANAAPANKAWLTRVLVVSYTERALNFSEGSALVGSTGRIGVTMPMDNVRAGIIEAATLLDSAVENADRGGSR